MAWRYARLQAPCRQPEFILTICNGLAAALQEILRVQPQLFADVANQIRIQVMMRSGQRQFRDAALAVDRQVSVPLSAMVDLRVKTAPVAVAVRLDKERHMLRERKPTASATRWEEWLRVKRS